MKPTTISPRRRVDPADARCDAVDDGGAGHVGQRLDLIGFTDQIGGFVGRDAEPRGDLGADGRVEDRAEHRQPEGAAERPEEHDRRRGHTEVA